MQASLRDNPEGVCQSAAGYVQVHT